VIGHFDIFDSTALHDWLACPELWRQRHALGLTLETTEEAPAAGSAFHKGVEAWYDADKRALSDDDAAVAAIAALREAWGPVPLVDTSKRTLPHYEVLLRSYMEQEQNFEVVRNEHYLEGNIDPRRSHYEKCRVCEPKNSQYCGIIDRTIQTEDGSRYVMDLKTTSAYLNESYFATYELSWQLIGYVLLERAAGERCDGAYVDAVHTDTRYQKVKPEHFRKQGPYTFPQWKIDAFLRVLDSAYVGVHKYAEKFGLDNPWPHARGAQRDTWLRGGAVEA
jgi:hypothetical protein